MPVVVTPARIELSIASLKGWCPHLLDEGAIYSPNNRAMYRPDMNPAFGKVSAQGG